MMIANAVEVPEDQDASSENIFASALGTIFPDETRNCHGDRGSYVIYKSRRLGDIKLSLADPSGEDGRKLFAHYVWNAALMMAELIGDFDASLAYSELNWSVSGERVLELGAGTGLAGLIAAHAGAGEVVITDFPSSKILANIKENVKVNASTMVRERITVRGHIWGDCEDEVPHTQTGRFTRILSADCLWIPGEHTNLARSMLRFLSPTEPARIWVTAGFHTGRSVVAQFFDIAVAEGLTIEKQWERDIYGNERAWSKQPASATETATELKRWIVIAVLRRSL